MVEKDLGQVIPDITATATIDNTVGTPEVNITVEELEELGRLVNKFKFNFLHLKGEKGDKPVKGVDYFTNQEKEQFTTETKALVTGEGSKQVSLINAETSKVIQQVKEIVAGNAATTNALTLNGKTRLEFEKETQGVAGGYNGTFPLTQATLNGIYLLPATGKFYVCTKEYNGGNLTAPNANFEELSVYTNRSKLDNLFGMVNINGVMRKLEIRTEKLWSNSTTTTDVIFSKPFTNNCLFVVAIDDVNIGDSSKAISIESNSLSKTGCKLIHNGITLSSYYYFAIGF